GLYSNFFASEPIPRPGRKAATNRSNDQQNFVQELRVQSADPDARLKWVAGAFYSRNKQATVQTIAVNFLENMPNVGMFFDPQWGFANGEPFGPGSTGFENYFGIPAPADAITWIGDYNSDDTQMALFA